MSDGKEVQRWVDPAMFASEKLSADNGPKVYLLQAPADPLGAIAAACKMYKGEVVRDLATVTDGERRDYLEQVLKTRLQMPFETVQFHFLLEGVTRSFTHQLVRQRTAAYAQESLRFAVIEDGLSDRVALPPSLVGVSLRGTGYEPWVRGEAAMPLELDAFGRLTDEQKNLVDWYLAVKTVEAAYGSSVNRGMPAEDARGLLPHNVTTRVHYITNLRGLLDHAGNRLCTQAQFEWRLVFSRIAEAVRGYDAYKDAMVGFNGYSDHWIENDYSWQYEALAELFRPICYATGKCEFKADFDRACSIRNRVQANADLNRPSSYWDSEWDEVEDNPVVAGVGPQSVVRDERNRPVFIGAIKPAEWLLDPGAAR
jgi:flavin-dependent thymidylate synthase